MASDETSPCAQGFYISSSGQFKGGGINLILELKKPRLRAEGTARGCLRRAHDKKQAWAGCHPPASRPLTCSIFSRAAASRSPVALKSKTRTSVPLREERGGVKRAASPAPSPRSSLPLGPASPSSPVLPLSPGCRPGPAPIQRSPPGLLVVVQRLPEPAHAGLHAAGGMRAVQVPGEGPAPQHLSPAEPLGVPKPWGRWARQLFSGREAALPHPLSP